MFNDATQHYNRYYHYAIPDGAEPEKRVNELFDAVMRNNRDALEEILQILASNTYFLVCSRLNNAGSATKENVDDVMQNIRLEIVKAVFRGLPEYVTSEKFYGWLIGLAENSIKNYIRRDKTNALREKCDTEEHSVFKAIEKKYVDEISTPEQRVINKEKQYMIALILQNYIEALQESDLPPHQLLTYCYAILVPQLFKKTGNIELLRKVDEISGRKKLPPNSHYNEGENCLEGDITRDSIVLMNWALDAMFQQRIEQLNAEFLNLYDMEKIAELEFCWGVSYQKNMEEDNDGIPEKKVVITDKYSKNTINNWPIRVARSLLAETEKKMISDSEIVKQAVHIVEEAL